MPRYFELKDLKGEGKGLAMLYLYRKVVFNMENIKTGTYVNVTVFYIETIVSLRS